MYVHVWKVTIEAVDGKYFLKCNNMQQKNRGMPWHNMLRVIDNRNVPENDFADVSMFDIRNWKMFNAHYGEDNNLGKQLMDAQHQCFKYDNAGVQLKYVENVRGSPDLSQYPILGHDTTDDDFAEMQFVM